MVDLNMQQPLADRLRPTCFDEVAGQKHLVGENGVYSDVDELRREWRIDRRFEAEMSVDERTRLLAGWHRAVERTLGWGKDF